MQIEQEAAATKDFLEEWNVYKKQKTSIWQKDTLNISPFSPSSFKDFCYPLFIV